MIAISKQPRAASHLIELGHRRIGFIGDQIGYQSTRTVRRLSEALEAVGIPFIPELVVQGDGKPGPLCAHGSAAGRWLTRRPRLLLQRYDGSGSDALDSAARAARAGGYFRGGFDDLFFASYTQPPLTTVRQPMRRMDKWRWKLFN